MCEREEVDRAGSGGCQTLRSKRTTMHVSSTFIAYYTVASVSMLCSAFVILTLWFHGSLRTSATRLLLALHVTLVCEELTSLPNVFNGNDVICTGVAFLHFYFALASIIAIGFLVISYRYHFFRDSLGINKFIQNWALWLVILFPTITLLPFITSAYQEHSGPWCSIGSHWDDYTWTFVVFYLWVWIILFSSAIWLAYTMVQIYKIDKSSGHRLFSTVGMYSIVSIAAWIPRSAEQLMNYTSGSLKSSEWVISYIPIYLAGILYTMVFLTEKKSLILFDSAFRGDQREYDERTQSTFSWEGSSFRFTNSSRAEGSQLSVDAEGGRDISMTERTTTRSFTLSPLTLTQATLSAATRSHGRPPSAGGSAASDALSSHTTSTAV